MASKMNLSSGVIIAYSKKTCGEKPKGFVFSFLRIDRIEVAMSFSLWLIIFLNFCSFHRQAWKVR